mgnify:CR=1 FL=1
MTIKVQVTKAEIIKPITKECIPQFLEMFLETAKQDLQTTGCIKPVAFFTDGERDAYFYDMTFTNDEEKEQTKTYLQAMYKKVNAKYLILVVDSELTWVLTEDYKMNNFSTSVQDSKNIEAIIIIMYSEGKRDAIIQHYIKEPDNTIKFLSKETIRNIRDFFTESLYNEPFITNSYQKQIFVS